MEDERHFSYYDVPSRRLQNQVKLLEKLEAGGYESKDKWVLTTEKIGIPITAMLLLLKESLDVITKEQAELSLIGKNKVQSSISEEDMINKIGIDPGIDYTVISNNEWNETEYYLPDIQTASGSATVEIYTGYEPKDSLFIPVSDMFESTNPNIVIAKNEVRFKSPGKERKTLYQVYKNIILFLEFAYAITERIKKEINSFATHTGMSIIKTPFPKELESNCNRRIAVVHGGDFRLEVEQENSRLIISKKVGVEKSFQQTYEEAINWINDVYGEMLRQL